MLPTNALPLFEPSSCGTASGLPDGIFPPNPENEIAIDGNQLRVLWIDDEIHCSDIEVRALELDRFHVECAETGEEGLSLAQKGTFDAILLDLRLANKSGLDVLELLIDSGVTAPIVILTGFAQVETAVAAMKLGAADYRMKPLDVEEIAPLLRRLVARRDQKRQPDRSQLAEVEWLRIQCDRFTDYVTKRQLIGVMLRVLLDRRLTLTSFFGCAEALRLVLTRAETSLTLLTSDMRNAILQAARTAPPRHPKLRDAIHVLERGGSKLSQEMFAGRVGFSRAYLSHLLTRQTGRKASEWCRGALMRAALRQVLQTTEQISQIAYAAGYNHAGQFDRDFEIMFGASPTKLRHFLPSQSSLPKIDAF